MNKFSKSDIANGYFEHRLKFKGIGYYGNQDEDEGLSAIEPYVEGAGMLSKAEILDNYDVLPEVADKLLRYQSELLANYRDTAIDFLNKADKYLEVKPYLYNKRLNQAVLSQYVYNEWDRPQMYKEFRPQAKLRNGIIGTSMSFVLFTVAASLVWPAHSPNWSDILSLGLVSFIWLGATAAVAIKLPGEYRARKVILRILDSQQKVRGQVSDT